MKDKFMAFNVLFESDSEGFYIESPSIEVVAEYLIEIIQK
jgi:hypothetical protein